MRRILWLAVVGVALTGWSERAAAGPPELVAQFATHPSDVDVMLLRYENAGEGFVFSRDGGASWQLMCGSALQPTGLTQTLSHLGRVAFDADGVVYMGTFGGMLRDDGKGCVWTVDGPFADQWVSDVTNHPTDATVLFAITSSGGEGKMNGVYRRSGADGAWTAVGSQDAILINRLHVVDLGGGKLRFYEGAVRGMLGMAPNFTPNYITRVSDDLGKTWAEYEFGEAKGTLRLEAVDTKNPDRIVAVVDHLADSPGGTPAPDDVLVSDDQGKTFTKWITVADFGGLAIAPDGRAWIGDRGNNDLDDPKDPRLYSAPSIGEKPTLLSDQIQVICLQYLSASERLFVCDRVEAGFVDPTDGAYTKSFAYRDLESFIDCSAKDLVELCRNQLVTGMCHVTHFYQAPICCNYSFAERWVDEETVPDFDTLCLDRRDGGTGDAGGDAAVDAGPPPPKSDSGCSCGAVGAPRRAPAASAALLALTCVAIRRSCRTHRRRR